MLTEKLLQFNEYVNTHADTVSGAVDCSWFVAPCNLTDLRITYTSSQRGSGPFVTEKDHVLYSWMCTVILSFFFKLYPAEDIVDSSRNRQQQQHQEPQPVIQQEESVRQPQTNMARYDEVEDMNDLL